MHRCKLKRLKTENFVSSSQDILGLDLAWLFNLKFRKGFIIKLFRKDNFVAKIKHSDFFRTISLVLITTFIALDISWAYPPEHNVPNSTLATPSLFQQQPVNEQTVLLRQSVFFEGKIWGSVLSIAKYLLKDKLPIKYMDQVLSDELGKMAEGIDLSRVIVKGGIILIPCEIKGKDRIIQIAPKGSLAAKSLVGYEWPEVDNYVIKEVAKKDVNLICSQSLPVSEPSQLPALPFKIAFFDWDGTISDTAGLTLEVFLMLYPVIMPGGTRVEAISVFHSRNLDGLVLEQQYDILVDIANEKGVKLTIPKFDYINRYESEKVKLIGKEAKEVNGACGFIRYLLDHGVSVYIVSAMLRKELVKQVEAFGLMNVVHEIFGGPSSEKEVASFAKSKSDYMRQILEKNGVSSGDAIMFGDTTRDRKSAEEAGVLFIGRAEDYARAAELSAGNKWPTIGDFKNTSQVLKVIEAAQAEKIRAIGNGVDIENLVKSLENSDSVEVAILKEIYGEDSLVLQRKRYITALKYFSKKYPGTREVSVARSGGRVIVAGHHSAPHLGYILNYPTHEDTIVIAGLNSNTSKDDTVRAGVVPSPSFKEGSFRDAEFSITSIPQSARDPEEGPRWWEYIEQVIGQIKNAKQAPKHFPSLDILVDGRPEYGALPISAGISSSAALDIAAFYAITGLLGIQHKIKADEFSAYAQNVEYNLGHLAGKDDQHGSQRGGFHGQGAVFMSNIPLVDDEGRIMLGSEPVPFPSDYRAILFDTGVHGEEAWPEFAVRLAEGEIGTFLLYREFKKRFPAIFEDKGLVVRTYPNLDKRQQQVREEYPPFFKPYFFSLPALEKIGLNIGKDELLKILNELPGAVTYEELRNGAFSADVELLDSFVEKLAQYKIDLKTRIFNPRGTAGHAILEQNRILDSIGKLKQAMASSNEADKERLMREFGQIQRETFNSLDKDYRNLDKNGKIAALVDILHADPRVLGAVHPGAGWGGRVCAWVHVKDADKVINNVIDKGYYSEDPKEKNPQTIIVSGPGYGASVLFSRDRLEKLNINKRIAKRIADGSLKMPKVIVKSMFRANDVNLNLNTISIERRKELIKTAYAFFLRNPDKKITRSLVAGGISSRIKKGRDLPNLIKDAQREDPERFGRVKEELPECRMLYPIAKVMLKNGSYKWIDFLDYYLMNIEKMNDNLENLGLGRPFIPRLFTLKRFEKLVKDGIARGKRERLHRWNAEDVLWFNAKESHPIIASEALVREHKNEFDNQKDYEAALKFAQESWKSGRYSLESFIASQGHGEYFHSQFDGGDKDAAEGYLDLVRNNVAFDMPSNSDNMASVDEDFLVIFGYMIEKKLDLVFEAATKAPGSAGASGGWGFVIDQDSMVRQVDDDILADSVTKSFLENDNSENNPDGKNPTLQNPNTLILRISEVIFATYRKENIDRAVASGQQERRNLFRKIAQAGREKFGFVPTFRIIRYSETGHQIGIIILETKLAHIQYGKGLRVDVVRVGSAIDAFKGQIPADRAQFIPLKELRNYEEDFLQAPRVNAVDKVINNRLIPGYSAGLVREIREEKARAIGTMRSPTDLQRHKTHTEEILRQLDEGILPDAYPYQAQFDITNFCNFKANPQFKDCINCVFPNNTREYVPFENLRRFLDNFAQHGGRSVFLTGGGEPGTYKDLPRLFEYMATSSLQLTLNTNGFFVRRMVDTPQDILKAVFSKEKGPSFISFSVHCDECYADLLCLNQLKKKLELDIITRATYLIHPDTTVDQITKAVQRCVGSGVDILDFKPAHMATENGREFLPNQQAYDEIKKLIKKSESGEIAIKIVSLRIDRLMVAYRKNRKTSDICLAPLTTIVSNALMQIAMCCDTKWFGLGGSGRELIAGGFPLIVQNYYVDAMLGIVKLNFRNCILGCNFEELNIEQSEKLGFLIPILRWLHNRSLEERLNEEQVKSILRQMFVGDGVVFGKSNTPEEPEPGLGEDSNSLLGKYEDIRRKFQEVKHYPDLESVAMLQIDKAYEPLENNARLPGQVDSLVTSFDLSKNELNDTLERLTDDIIKVLPEGTAYHRVDPATYHISVMQIQDLPFDSPENKLTDDERRTVEETVAKVAAKVLPYKVKFRGLRFGVDGGVIAVFEDEESRTQSLRESLINECNKVCNNKVSLARKKPLVSITLMRIFSNIKDADLTRLKAKAEELKDLSSLGLTMELKSVTFYHETRFMHSAFDYSRSYGLGEKNEDITIDEASASKLFKIANNGLKNLMNQVTRSGSLDEYEEGIPRIALFIMENPAVATEKNMKSILNKLGQYERGLPDDLRAHACDLVPAFIHANHALATKKRFEGLIKPYISYDVPSFIRANDSLATEGRFKILLDAAMKSGWNYAAVFAITAFIEVNPVLANEENLKLLFVMLDRGYQDALKAVYLCLKQNKKLATEENIRKFLSYEIKERTLKKIDNKELEQLMQQYRAYAKISKFSIHKNRTAKNVYTIPKDVFGAEINVVDLWLTAISKALNIDEVVVCPIGSSATFPIFGRQYCKYIRDFDLLIFVSQELPMINHKKIRKVFRDLLRGRGLKKDGMDLAELPEEKLFGPSGIFHYLISDFEGLDKPIEGDVYNYKYDHSYYGTEKGLKRFNAAIADIDARILISKYVLIYMRSLKSIKGENIKDIKILASLASILGCDDLVKKCVEKYDELVKGSMEKHVYNLSPYEEAPPPAASSGYVLVSRPFSSDKIKEEAMALKQQFPQDEDGARVMVEKSIEKTRRDLPNDKIKSVRLNHEKDTDTAQVAHLFKIVESSVNNKRTKFIESGNKAINSLATKTASGNPIDIGTINKKMATAEIRQRVERAIAIIDGLEKEKVSPETKASIELLKKNINQFEADGAVGSLIILARRAQRENQKLIIGLETDWIPGMNVKGSLQRNAIAALMKEIDAVGEALKSMGLDNVEVIRGNSNDLASVLLTEANKTHTSLHNIVVMASANVINSDTFTALRNADESDRPFLAGIDPTELIKLYTEFGEATSNQLYIRLTQMLYMTLELAAGKEPPQTPMIVSYDSKQRIVIFLPKAEPRDYEALKNTYAAEKTALSAA